MTNLTIPNDSYSTSSSNLSFKRYTDLSYQDLIKFLSCLFIGRVLVAYDKMQNTYTIIEREEAENYVSNFGPDSITNPFDLDCSLTVDISEIYKWFMAEDGISKIIIKWPTSDEEQKQAIRTIVIFSPTTTSAYNTNSYFHTSYITSVI